MLLADFILIAGFIAVGVWLEGIGGKHGILDEFLTPVPLAWVAVGIDLVQAYS